MKSQISTGAPEYEYKKQPCGFIYALLCVFVFSFLAFMRIRVTIILLIGGHTATGCLLLLSSLTTLSLIQFYSKSCSDPSFITGRPKLVKFWPFAGELASICINFSYDYFSWKIVSMPLVRYSLMFLVNLLVTVTTYSINEDNGFSIFLCMKPMIRVKAQRPLMPPYGHGYGYGYAINPQAAAPPHPNQSN